MISNLTDKTVGEVVAEDYRTAFVFKSFGIDYCCGGKKQIAKACLAKGVDILALEKEIQTIKNQSNFDHRFSEWSPEFLTDYIVNNHHSYVVKTLPELVFLAEKVSRVHGDLNPELHQMQELVLTLNTELLNHLKKEEEELFPAIKANALNTNLNNKKLKETILNELEGEHEIAGDLMRQLEEITHGFVPPIGACTSYVIYFKTLKEFQDDLHRHVHLENNVLFPKVLEQVSYI